MQRFIDFSQARPSQRSADLRSQDFAEIYGKFKTAEAANQASRCAQCGVPFCQIHCPLHNNIPDWLMLAAAGRLREAYELAASTNNFPEICGRICPQDRLCEGNCVIETSGHGAVTIGAVESYITEHAFAQGWVTPPTIGQEKSQSVGIVGAGPAGLAAAEMLRRQGYRVVVYDRYDRVGGLLIYGIPNFKLEKSIVARRESLLRDCGVEFHLNCEIGRDLPFAELRASHSAILLATGVYQARRIDVPGAALRGVVPALSYLIQANRRDLGDPAGESVPSVTIRQHGSRHSRGNPADESVPSVTGQDVVVIGGGDTAMDCLRTAIRQDARSVTCLYRRDRANMPGSRREVTLSEEEGVTFAWESSPLEFVGRDGNVASVSVQGMRLGLPGPDGRRQPEANPGTKRSIPAQIVIEALGFSPEDVVALYETPELATAPDGRLLVETGATQTSLDGVFAAGDIVRGASLVVWAIHDGRIAARDIQNHLTSCTQLGTRAPGAHLPSAGLEGHRAPTGAQHP